ncbi:hypothetical protein HL658_36255 [Azospirillum sp. RWY-5-1]|nr:hypothetical protein [Azospirillum oleiclasticum]NYZ18021.1 hypothetical protein [Azospirillum oleiclasticum]
MEIDKRSDVWLQCAIDVEMQHRGWVSIRCVRSVADASPERVRRMALDLYGPAAFTKPPPRTPAERQKDARTRRRREHDELVAALVWAEANLSARKRAQLHQRWPLLVGHFPDR